MLLLDHQRIVVAPVETKRHPVFDWAILAVIILVFFLVRFRLREMVLERDEGEYAYAGQLMLQGIPPYQLAYNMKLPGTYAAYALIMMFFGQTPAGIHIGLALVNAMTTLLVFLLARRFFKSEAALAAAASYGLLSTSHSVLGFAGHATHFVVLPAMAGILLLLIALEKRFPALLMLSGFLTGTAYVMKQPGAVFVVFGLIYLIRKRASWRSLALYSAAAALPFAFTCAWLYRAGAFDRFWFWTATYLSQYAAVNSPAIGILMLLGSLPGVIGASLGIWLLAAFGSLRAAAEHRFFLLSLLVCSFAGVSAGFYYRPHYFILMLPVMALLVASGVEGLQMAKSRKIALALFSSAFLLALAWQANALFRQTPQQAIEANYGGNPFAESPRVAAYLRAHTAPRARIGVIGSEPQIYFYAQRHSATGYIYTYGLMEPQFYARKMQDEMITEIEQSNPEYLVYVRSRFSWLQNNKSDTHVLQWAHDYLESNYEPVESIGDLSIYRLSPRRRDGLAE